MSQGRRPASDPWFRAGHRPPAARVADQEAANFMSLIASLLATAPPMRLTA
jgi:hypothetical protein